MQENQMARARTESPGDSESQALVISAVRVATCSCESCFGNAPERVRSVWGKLTEGLNALKNRWLEPVAGKVALERLAEGLEAFEGQANSRRERR